MLPLCAFVNTFICVYKYGMYVYERVGLRLSMEVSEYERVCGGVKGSDW